MDNSEGWAKELFKGDFSHTGALFGVIGTFAIGCLIGVVVVSQIMNVLLRKWRKETFFTIIGFIAGSVFVLFFNLEIFNYYRAWSGQVIENTDPLMPMWAEIIVGLVVLALCAFASYRLVVAQRKKDAQEKAKEIPNE